MGCFLLLGQLNSNCSWPRPCSISSSEGHNAAAMLHSHMHGCISYSDVTHVIPLLSCWVKVFPESFLQETNPAQQQQLMSTKHISPNDTFWNIKTIRTNGQVLVYLTSLSDPAVPSMYSHLKVMLVAMQIQIGHYAAWVRKSSHLVLSW